MKKNVWVATNIFFFLVATMVVITILSAFADYRIAILSGILTIFSTGLVAVYVFRFKAYKVKAMKDIVKDIDEKVLFSKMSVPIAIIGDFNDIIWVNEKFSSDISPISECIGMNSNELIKNTETAKLNRNDKNNVMIGERSYSAYVKDFNNCTVLMFIDDTDYKNMERKLLENRPAVVIISLDNEDELTDYSNEFSLQVLASIESTVRKWATSADSLFKKLSDGKYLIIMQDKFINSFSEDKFGLLDEIRNIKLSNGVSATISIGIGRGGSNFSEDELWARQALEMALGRGGDQAIIKEADSFKFFGGNSKGVERRDRVKTRIISSMLIDSINESDNVFIMGHRFSDLDSVGASMGLYGCITAELNKKAYIVINKEQSLAKNLMDNIEGTELSDACISGEQADELCTDNSLLIVVDTHSKGFLEYSCLYEKCKKTVVIDHHRMMVNRIENPLIFYHDSFASSTSEMVTDLLRYMGDNAISRETAQVLLAGIMLDTKNFVIKTGVRTFEAAAFLRKKGADTVKVKELFSDTIKSYKMKYDIISGVKLTNNCAIACVSEETENIRIIAAQAADELLGIKDVKASFVIFKNGDEVNISARSLGVINVQIIMEKLGGGGHLTMAATQIKDITVERASQNLQKVIHETLNTNSDKENQKT